MLECCFEANSYVKNNNTYYYHTSIWQIHFMVIHKKDNLIHPLQATDFPKARIKSYRTWGPSNVTESYILFWNLFSDRSCSVPFSWLSLSPSRMPAPSHSVTGWQLPARPASGDRLRENKSHLCHDSLCDFGELTEPLCAYLPHVQSSDHYNMIYFILVGIK